MRLQLKKKGRNNVQKKCRSQEDTGIVRRVCQVLSGKRERSLGRATNDYLKKAEGSERFSGVVDTELRLSKQEHSWASIIHEERKGHGQRRQVQKGRR